MKKETGTGTAEVQDFSKNEDGTEKDGSTNVTVNYNFDYEVLESRAELDEKYSTSDLIALANARLKSSANSGERQKAIAPYAQNPNSDAAIRERMIKDAMKLGQSKEQATTFIDSLLASKG